jgi:exosome complex RNA-binding protein Csl4
MDIDKETLAYLRQNIENEIKQNLESRLFKLYTIIGAAFLGGVGIIGFPWAVSYIDSKIQTAVDHQVEETKAITDKARDTAEAARRDVDKALAQIELKRADLTRALDDLQLRSSRATEQLNQFRGEMQQRSEDMAAQIDDSKRKVDDIRGQAQVLSDRLRTAVPDAGVVQSLASNLDKVVEQVKQLDLAMKTMAQRTDSPVSAAEDDRRAVQLSSLQQMTGQSVEQIQKAAPSLTVYLQFAVLTRDNAKAISAQLATRGWRIPGEERIDGATGLSEIRCYYQADCDQAAPRLKADTETTLGQLGYSAPSIDIRPLLDYTPKPRQGILEIWFGRGRPSAS